MSLLRTEPTSDDEPTAPDIAEALANLCAAAKRCQRVTHEASTLQPTDWDRRHRQINDALDEYERRVTGEIR